MTRNKSSKAVDANAEGANRHQTVRGFDVSEPSDKVNSGGAEERNDSEDDSVIAKQVPAASAVVHHVTPEKSDRVLGKRVLDDEDDLKEDEEVDPWDTKCQKVQEESSNQKKLRCKDTNEGSFDTEERTVIRIYNDKKARKTGVAEDKLYPCLLFTGIGPVRGESEANKAAHVENEFIRGFLTNRPGNRVQNKECLFRGDV